jgi:hypothetical protein
MSDMRDDLDELGRRLWPATDALLPKQTGATVGHAAPARRWWRLEPLATLLAAVLLVGVIGGAVVLGRSLSSRTPVPGTPTPTAPAPTVGTTPVTSATPSPTPAPVPHVIVWTATDSTGTMIRVGAASGGFRTVATLPASSEPVILGAGGHRLLFWEQVSGHVLDLDLNSGAITDHGGESADSFYGAAFSPDGTRVEYLRQTAANTGQIQVLDFNSGATTGLQSFTTNPLDVPEVWSTAALAALRDVIPNADRPLPGFALLDPTTGARTATTDASVLSWAIAADGVHAAHATTGVAGPVGPSGRDIATETIGSPPQTILQESSNHALTVLGIDVDGSAVLYTDDPTMGGYAGITLSPDFGLFTFAAGHRTQVAHYTGTPGYYVAARYLSATDFVVVALNESPTLPTCTLMLSTGGGPPTRLDTLPGGPSSVFVVTGQ